jgi:hypothetical protein
MHTEQLSALQQDTMLSTSWEQVTVVTHQLVENAFAVIHHTIQTVQQLIYWFMITFLTITDRLQSLFLGSRKRSMACMFNESNRQVTTTKWLPHTTSEVVSLPSVNVEEVLDRMIVYIPKPIRQIVEIIITDIITFSVNMYPSLANTPAVEHPVFLWLLKHRTLTHTTTTRSTSIEAKPKSEGSALPAQPLPTLHTSNTIPRRPRRHTDTRRSYSLPSQDILVDLNKDTSSLQLNDVAQYLNGIESHLAEYRRRYRNSMDDSMFDSVFLDGNLSEPEEADELPMRLQSSLDSTLQLLQEGRNALFSQSQNHSASYVLRLRRRQRQIGWRSRQRRSSRINGIVSRYTAMLREARSKKRSRHN